MPSTKEDIFVAIYAEAMIVPTAAKKAIGIRHMLIVGIKTILEQL